jgi:hypothetical protein
MRSPVARLAIVIASAVFACAAAFPCHAASCRPARPFDLEVLVDGRPLAELAARGTAYVEALAGREYAVRLTNRTGDRIAVALAVDGLNVIDAKHTSAREGRKWILGPWQSITLDGWQTSAATARRFFFTSERRSYGAWLGKTGDLGVISAAFFRERQLAPPAAAIAPAEPMGGAPSESKNRSDAPAAKDELAATGIGRRVDHPVIEVDFEEEDAPSYVATLRYEYHDALVSLGVLPRDVDGEGLARRERSHGFEDSGFAPDPGR